MIIAETADDIIVGFQYESRRPSLLGRDARRLGGLDFASSGQDPLIDFGRFAATNRERRGLGKPETFAFLGFTFICGKARNGDFQIKRKTRADRMRAKLNRSNRLRWRMHRTIAEQGHGWSRWSRATSTTSPADQNRAPGAFRHHILDLGGARSSGAVSTTGRYGPGWTTGAQFLPMPEFFIPGPGLASPSNTRGGSRMRECRTYGSGRGARSNARPYRDRDPRLRQRLLRTRV